MEIWKITDNLYQSGDIYKPLPEDITAVISLRTNCPDNAFLMPNVKAYLWLPITDKAETSPSCILLHSVAQLMAQWHQAGLKILTHCAAGISRSTMINMAYLMYSAKHTPEIALATIRNVNPYAGPNDGFMLSLNRYHDFLVTYSKEIAQLDNCHDFLTKEPRAL
jgi:protein-tyrosine phosphatase